MLLMLRLGVAHEGRSEQALPAGRLRHAQLLHAYELMLAAGMDLESLEGATASQAHASVCAAQRLAGLGRGSCGCHNRAAQEVPVDQHTAGTSNSACVLLLFPSQSFTWVIPCHLRRLTLHLDAAASCCLHRHRLLTADRHPYSIRRPHTRWCAGDDRPWLWRPSHKRHMGDAGGDRVGGWQGPGPHLQAE